MQRIWRVLPVKKKKKIIEYFKFRGGMNSECVYGYQGPLCGTCIKGFGKLGKNCYNCKGKITNVFAALSVFICALIAIVLLVMYYLFLKICLVF